ncbi:MAG: DNA polymerase III subunit alpha [Alphaproteobacteria bacterium]|nr:DNA polymerase III subunit alpha [Alphaproteobacteria bacterium]
MAATFVHLHLHTAFSLSEGAIRIGELIDLCKRHGMPAVALTDSDNLFGALEFSQYCKKAGVQPIIGSAIALKHVGEGLGEARGLRRPKRLVLLAQNERGYSNLIRLSSLSYLETPPGEPPTVTVAQLAEHHAGLIALTGGPEGPLGRLLDEQQIEAAEAMLLRLSEIFAGRLYVELQRHGLPREQRIEAALLPLAFKHNLPLLATNEPYFTDESAYEAHDALLCIAEGSYVSDRERRRLTPEHRFKSPEEMALLFKDLPEAIRNTLVVAKRCAVMAPMRNPILPVFAKDEANTLRREAKNGLDQRLANEVVKAETTSDEREAKAAPYRRQLEFELDVIIKMGFAGYFLIVADFIRWAKEHDIPVGPGRGSGAGSVVAWALTITDLDPLRFGLIFERFLNPDRVSMPDFDIDFCQDRRDEVIRYVQEKYGRDRVAQIITFGTLQARAVLRDVGRVQQMPYGLVDRICKMVPNNPANPVKLKDAIENEPRLKHLRDTEDGVDPLLDIGMKLEGLYRHASTHAAGVVIGDRPLDQLVPLYLDPRSPMPATQFSMKYVESAGLVKFDFLGLKTLTVIDRAQKLLRQKGVEVDIARLPLDDLKTYEMLQRAESIGVFQFESSGMRDLLREAMPSNIEDLIALVALYRPGPMENIPKYVACKHGREQPEFLHETITPIVADTYGVIIYQEQVMQIAQRFAGYSLGQADLLRRAMGKKIKAEMDAQRDIFVKGATERGVDRERAVYVFDLVAKFAGYGFNKAHSAGYALVAYQTAWLKANHPVEFFAASMALDQHNTDKLNVFREEMKRLGIPLLPPEINRSEVDFSVEAVGEGRTAVRYGLAAVRNVGQQAMASVVGERAAKGRFRSLPDFAARIDPRDLNKRQIENLARAGAFDPIERNRARVFAAADMIMRRAASTAEERSSRQSNLFDGSGGPAELPLPDVKPWKQIQELQEEFEALGFHLSAHPLDSYGASLRRLEVIRFADLARQVNGEIKRVKLAGSITGRQERTSARGNKFAFVQLSDPSGSFEVTAFSEVLSAHRDLLEVGQKVLLSVDARMEEGQARLTVQHVQSLDAAAAQAAAGLEIVLGSAVEADAAVLAALREQLAEARGGKGKVTVHLPLSGQRREVIIDLPGGFSITPIVRDNIAGVRGVAQLRDI